MADSTIKPQRRRAAMNSCVTQEKSNEVDVGTDSVDNADLNLRARLSQAREDPLGAMLASRVRVGQSRAEHDAASLSGSIVAYEAAFAVKRSPSKWRAMTESPIWLEIEGHKPKADEPDDFLSWTMKLVLVAKDKRGKDRANVYRGAFQAKFDEGARAETLIAFVRSQGGIDAAYRNGLAKTKKDKLGDDKTEEINFSNGSEDKDDVAEIGNVEAEPPFSGEGGTGLKIRKALFSRIISRLKTMKGRRIMPMLVGASPETFAKVMGRYVERGEVNIRCTLTRTSDGWVEMTCIKAWRSSSTS